MNAVREHLRSIFERIPPAKRIERLDGVLWHYRDQPRASVGQSELKPLTISDTEFQHIEAFLRTLDSDVRSPDQPYPATPAN